MNILLCQKVRKGFKDVRDGNKTQEGWDGEGVGRGDLDEQRM